MPDTTLQKDIKSFIKIINQCSQGFTFKPMYISEENIRVAIKQILAIMEKNPNLQNELNPILSELISIQKELVSITDITGDLSIRRYLEGDLQFNDPDSFDGSTYFEQQMRKTTLYNGPAEQTFIEKELELATKNKELLLRINKLNTRLKNLKNKLQFLKNLSFQMKSAAKTLAKKTVASAATEVAESQALKQGKKAAAKKAIASTGAKLLIGAAILGGAAIKCANPALAVYSIGADNSFPVGGDYYSNTSQFYRNKYSFEKFEKANFFLLNFITRKVIKIKFGKSFTRILIYIFSQKSPIMKA